MQHHYENKQREQKAKQEERKRKLQSKFLNEMKAKAFHATLNEQPSPKNENYDNVIQKLRKEVKRLERRRNEQLEKYKIERSNHQRTKKKLLDKGRKLYDYERIKEDAIKQKRDMEIQIEYYKSQVKTLNQKLDDLSIRSEKESGKKTDTAITNTETFQLMNNPTRKNDLKRKPHYQKRPGWYREVNRSVMKRVEQSRLIDFGYISKRNDEWNFYNLMNKRFNLNVTFVEPKEDVPAKVVLVDGVAYLREVYKSDLDLLHAINKSGILTWKSQINTPENSELPYPYFGDFEVLLIGEPFDMKLEKYGLVTNWFNPMKDDTDLLKGKAMKSDLIIVSKVASLSVYEAVKEYKNVEVINTFDKNRVIARIRTAGIRLGLIKDRYQC
ncbi:hypothetical protein NDS46_31765 (plasmid) [Paenibacillus thiaminolyticus]|uniref:hypothetical protein n=1 Tax=Paenibacillus thiaminolyticus TaxID=49283 RepID=UPI00232C029B|nr:hypothetical protein [Paenibacillus thiaminolyticus]WCF11536.1 hypothetical protein NDS46_31765 [Paenibacillus thiaminolyticus]